MPIVALEIVIVALLILLNGAFAMAEMAIVTARKVRLEARANGGDRRAQAALALANEPSQLLSTVQIGITLVGILAGAFGGATISRAVATQIETVPALAPYAEGVGLAVVVLVIAYFTLIFGELVPKRLALSNPEGIAAAIAVPMQWLSRLVSPAVRLLGGSTEMVLRVLGVQHQSEEAVTEEEINLQIARGAQAGIFDEVEREIVEAVFRLGDRRVGSLMTPRPEVDWLDLDRGTSDHIRRVLSSGHSHFPVCRADLDHVEGIVAARDVLASALADAPPSIRNLGQPPLFVPESLHAFRLLERFKEHSALFAVVVDEYGGTQGIVTSTDILKALVGDIPTARDGDEPGAVMRDDGSWLVDGLLTLDELREILDVDKVPGGRTAEYYTIGGLIMSRLTRIPKVGDRLEWAGWRFEVVDMDGNRIDKVLISTAPTSAGD